MPVKNDRDFSLGELILQLVDARDLQKMNTGDDEQTNNIQAEIDEIVRKIDAHSPPRRDHPVAGAM